MKKIIISLLGFIIISSSTQAFTVATSNIITPDANGASPVYDASGNIIPVGTGAVAVGYFATISDLLLSSTNFATLKSDFQQLGTPLPFNNGFAVDGFFDVSVGAAVGSGSPFIGKNVYVFFGNGTTIANSTNIAVWKGATLFDDDNNVDSGNVTITQADFATRLLVGSDGGVKNHLGIDFTKTISLASAPIPEPSAALLGALGALGLLRRRRI